MIGLIDVTDIHDAPQTPDPLGVCLHCNRLGVEATDDEVASGAGDFANVTLCPFERCLFCGRTQ